MKNIIDLDDLSTLSDSDLVDALYALVLELGWNIAVITPDGEMPKTDAMVGMVIGTDQYIKDVLGVSEGGDSDALLN